jgi:hypothetical protein
MNRKQLPKNQHSTLTVQFSGQSDQWLGECNYQFYIAIPLKNIGVKLQNIFSSFSDTGLSLGFYISNLLLVPR